MSRKTKIIIAAVNVLLLILASICVLRCGTVSRTLLSQQAAERWQGEREERFAQVSCFFEAGSEKTEDEIRTFRESLDKKLADAGVEAAENGNYWTDAYVCASTAQTQGERGSGEAQVFGVGGDFFLFHPYELLSGSYFSDEDVMKDRVVIDRELAWKLFGGTELEGMTMEINGKPFYIAGVIARETDSFSKRCFSEEPMVFTSASALSSTEAPAEITSYELIMLDPISGFAKQTVADDIGKNNAVVVENSARYDFETVLKMLSKFGERTVRTEAVAYPYWENAAILSEDSIALMYAVTALLLLFPFICAVILLVKLIILLVKKLRELSRKAKDAWEDRYGIEEELREKRRIKREQKQSAPKREKRGRRKKAVRAPVQREEAAAVPEDSLQADVESIVREVLGEKDEF